MAVVTLSYVHVYDLVTFHVHPSGEFYQLWSAGLLRVNTMITEIKVFFPEVEHFITTQIITTVMNEVYWMSALRNSNVSIKYYPPRMTASSWSDLPWSSDLHMQTHTGLQMGGISLLSARLHTPTMRYINGTAHTFGLYTFPILLIMTSYLASAELLSV